GFTQLRWSSAQYRWAGFEVQAHRLGPCGRLSDFGVEDTLLGLCLTGRAEMEVGTGKQLHRVVSLPGRFTLLARGYEQKFIAWSGARELLYVSLGTAQLRRFMGRDDDSIQINADPQYAIADPQITRLVLNMRDEILAGCPSGKLYGQCLSLALASRVRARYSGHAERSESSEKCRCGFSPGEVQRLRDYIRAHLTRDIGLAELAGVLGLSAHHFSMLFK